MICLTESWCFDHADNEHIYELPGYTSMIKLGIMDRGWDLHLFHDSSIFKLRPDLSINNEVMEAFSIEIINKIPKYPNKYPEVFFK